MLFVALAIVMTIIGFLSGRLLPKYAVLLPGQ